MRWEPPGHKLLMARERKLTLQKRLMQIPIRLTRCLRVHQTRHKTLLKNLLFATPNCMLIRPSMVDPPATELRPKGSAHPNAQDNIENT